jgi:hypothetical protein
MTLKEILGRLPYTAELYDTLRPGRPQTRYNLSQLEKALPSAVEQVRPFAGQAPTGKRILLFATLHYWVEQAAIIALTLRGLGHDVSIAYLPFGDWSKEVPVFDLRRQDLYTRRVLAPLAGLVQPVSLLAVRPAPSLPTALVGAIENVSAFDTMYTDQVEDFDRSSALYNLRMQRNRQAALTAQTLLQESRPDVVVIPNGTITELGAVYQVARQMGINTVTYEFNDQREQIWVAQNDEVMRQNTDLLWSARSGQLLSMGQREMIEALESARMGGRAFGKSTRQWQDAATVGGEKIRASLGLDSRPVVLLATNVLGDSLTLGRNIFTASMAEWIAKTVQYFATQAGAQLVIRIHPGERLTHGQSMVDVIQAALPQIPDHIHVIKPMEKINTYDLMEISDLGLVYTTTTGMEMCMNGIPVIACGKTHYRKRGFTYDPSSWEEYFAILAHILPPSASSDKVGGSLQRLSPAQVETAWEYAYRFFFEYPIPFPWRLMHFWKDLDVWPVGRVLSAEGRQEFGKAFAYLAGETLDWKS